MSGMAQKLPAADGVSPRGLAPLVGDVVITVGSQMPRRYALTQVPSQPQLTCSSRDTALDFARRFASHHSVDVWLQDQGQLTRVHNHRMTEGSKS